MTLLIIILLLLGAFVFFLMFAFRGAKTFEGRIDLSRRDAPPSPPDRRIDENVLFTVYRPKAIAPDKWYPLLAFAHLAERRTDAAPDIPDPSEEVQKIAERYLGEKAAAAQQITRQQSSRGIPERQMLTFFPVVEGVEFNPPDSREIRWVKDVHWVDFEMKTTPDREGQYLRGTLTVFAGGIIAGEVPLTIEVNSSKAAEVSAADGLAEASAAAYQKIFPSYSRKDEDIVVQFEAHVESLGHEYLRDVKKLRAGEDFDQRLMALIHEAEVFQLFWSWNSIKSEFVQKEWRYALSLNRPDFIRPTYWEEPRPETDDLPPTELARLHFYRFRPPRDKAAPPSPPPPPPTIRTLSLIILCGLLVGMAMLFITDDYQLSYPSGGVYHSGPPERGIRAAEPYGYGALMHVDFYPEKVRAHETRRGHIRLEAKVVRRGAERRYEVFGRRVGPRPAFILVIRDDGRYLIFPDGKQYAELNDIEEDFFLAPSPSPPFLIQLLRFGYRFSPTVESALHQNRSATLYVDEDQSGTVWVDDETGFPLLIDVHVGFRWTSSFDPRGRLKVEFTGVSEHVDPSSFEVPSGYQKVPEGHLYKTFKKRFRDIPWRPEGIMSGKNETPWQEKRAIRGRVVAEAREMPVKLW